MDRDAAGPMSVRRKANELALPSNTNASSAPQENSRGMLRISSDRDGACHQNEVVAPSL